MANPFHTPIPWQEVVPFEALVDSYQRFCLLRGEARYALHRVQLGKFIARFYEPIRPRAPKGTKGNKAARPYSYKFGPLHEARARFCEVQNLAIQWEQPGNGPGSPVPVRARSAGIILASQ